MILKHVCYYKIDVNINKGETMKKYIRKSVIRTSIGFMLIIAYCIICLISKFSYIDLLYLIVVVVFFALFLKIVRDL